MRKRGSMTEHNGDDGGDGDGRRERATAVEANVRNRRIISENRRREEERKRVACPYIAVVVWLVLEDAHAPNPQKKTKKIHNLIKFSSCSRSIRMHSVQLALISPTEQILISNYTNYSAPDLHVYMNIPMEMKKRVILRERETNERAVVAKKCGFVAPYYISLSHPAIRSTIRYCNKYDLVVQFFQLQI
jgi:hypothetical protein